MIACQVANNNRYLIYAFNGILIVYYLLYTGVKNDVAHHKETMRLNGSEADKRHLMGKICVN